MLGLIERGRRAVFGIPFDLAAAVPTVALIVQVELNEAFRGVVGTAGYCIGLYC